MTVTPEALAGWMTHIGRSERSVQLLDVESLRRFAVACGLPADVEAAVPALAHWAWFLPTVADQQIDADGHPKRGGLLPAVTLPRRMFAGGTMSFEAPLELGEPAQLEARIANVSHKSGRTGELIFVEVDRVLSQQGKAKLRERQTIVYRDQGAPVPLPSVEESACKDAQWQPGPLNLFRFSAVTFNAHRIHYDQTYTAVEEGYPALVVHGTFTAVKLAALAQRQAGRRLASFEFKGLAPLFVNQPIRFSSDTAAGAFTAIRCDGAVAMTAKVTYR